MRNKEKQRKPYLPSALMMGAGAWTGRAGMDLERIGNRLGEWSDAVQSAPRRTNTSSMADSIRASRVYADKARDIIRSRVGGLPIPYWALNLKAVDTHATNNRISHLEAAFGNALQPRAKELWDYIHKDPNSTASRYIRKFLDRGNAKGKDYWGKFWRRAHTYRPEIEGHFQHYRNFFSKDMDQAALRNYMAFGKSTDYSPEGWSILSRVGRDLTPSSALRQLPAKDRAKAIQILKGKAKYLAGAGVGGGGVAHKYFNDAYPILRRASSGMKGLGAALLGGGVLMGSRALALNRVNAFQKKGSSALEDLSYAAGGTGGAYAIHRGIRNLRRPLEAGVTFSDLVKKHGAGHKGPGTTLFKLLQQIQQENPDLKINLTKPVLNQYGLFSDPRLYGHRYDMLMDTGMGFTSQWFDRNNELYQGHLNDGLRVGKLHDNRRNVPRIAPGGYVGYMTDLGGTGNPGESYMLNVDSPLRRRLNKLFRTKDNYIVWGHNRDNPFYNHAKDLQSRFVRENFNLIRPSIGAGAGFPAMDPGAMSALRNLQNHPRQEMMQRLMESDVLSAEQKRLFKPVLDGKKQLLMVTGSGRGDNVALRLMDLDKEIKRRGLSNKFLIGGVLGENYNTNSLSRAVASNKRFLTFKGRIPQEWYVGIPGLAERTWASTGTSAGMESLGTPNPVSFMPTANEWRDREIAILKRHGKKLQQRFGGNAQEAINAMSGGALELDRWNKGNKDLYFMTPGVGKAQSASDFLDQVLAQTPASREEAVRRGSKYLRQSAKAQADVKHQLHTLLRKMNKRKMRVGGAQIAGGSALLAAPLLYSAHRNRKNPFSPSSETSGLNRRAIALGGGAALTTAALLAARRRRRRRREEEDEAGAD